MAASAAGTTHRIQDGYEIAPERSATIHRAMNAIAARHPALTLSGPGSAELSIPLLASLPAELLSRLHSFRGHGSTGNTMLIRGLPIGDIGATPPSATSPRSAGAHRAALLELCLMTLLGEPFTFDTLYEGRLVQDVVPARGEETAQTSEGSTTFLDWHVEDACSTDRCDYFGLLCLRGDPAASTMLAAVTDVTLSEHTREVLAQPRFVVAADVAHASPRRSRPLPVLTGDAHDPEIRFDALYTRPADATDHDAAHAFEHLRQAIADAAVAHVLEPGDLLVVDNRRVVHARSAFRPRFDGTDRWLMRLMVCACLRRHRRRQAQRVIELTTA